jgi:hypothetical protein
MIQEPSQHSPDPITAQLFLDTTPMGNLAFIGVGGLSKFLPKES